MDPKLLASLFQFLKYSSRCKDQNGTSAAKTLSF